jgi:uncharacterized membrane protein
MTLTIGYITITQGPSRTFFVHHSLAPRCSSFHCHSGGTLHILKITLLDLDFEENISGDNKLQEGLEKLPTF